MDCAVSLVNQTQGLNGSRPKVPRAFPNAVPKVLVARSEGKHFRPGFSPPKILSVPVRNVWYSFYVLRAEAACELKVVAIQYLFRCY